MVLFSCSMLRILCYEWITTGAGEFINRKVDGDLKMVGVHGMWALVLSSHLHFSPLKPSLVRVSPNYLKTLGVDYGFFLFK
jgi:hypothetical protein